MRNYVLYTKSSLTLSTDFVAARGGGHAIDCPCEAGRAHQFLTGIDRSTYRPSKFFESTELNFQNEILYVCSE